MRVLVAEDNQDILGIIKDLLESLDLEIDTAIDGEKAYKLFSTGKYDLVITDAMMPIMDGYTLAKMIRKKDDKVPIIMLTALSEEYDEVKGFESGIDDYIKKPFSYTVFLKRVEARLKNNSEIEENTIVDGNLVVNLNTYDVTYNDVLVDLTPKEFEILKFLMQNHTHVVSREQLLEKVWGFNYYGDTRNIDTHIKNLRKKLPEIEIKTVKGIGYIYVINE